MSPAVGDITDKYNFHASYLSPDHTSDRHTPGFTKQNIGLESYVSLLKKSSRILSYNFILFDLDSCIYQLAVEHKKCYL